ncbi:MAG TPA: SIMPL domain-containing protein [Bacteroidia bacterium]|nr:SIMPL domain-containing protein [Sphingobacteriales bacterium]HPD63918.1 SIMPL domain-containing protein [Bacteroidia bacterium]HRS57721.1 SIMPL domain-containing protein [Bacteroidia bacterium]HRU67064.1 SIMPL domain-containing protein [Bacteroidia bacterium]
MKENNKSFLIALGLIIGLGINGYFIGRAIQRFNKEDRSISVKGFSEREVKADLAVWTIKIRITTNDLSTGSQEIETNKSKIIEFLVKNGIKTEEILQQDLSVSDKLAREYVEPNMGGFRYILENTLQVRSTNVDNIQKVSRMTDELVKAGVVISNTDNYQPAVQYIFTRLKDIKPEMLKEATQNAKKAALEFTKESGVKLGSLKKASQGLFTITDRDDYYSGQGGEGGYYPSSVLDVFKKVRVVVNIEYSVR